MDNLTYVIKITFQDKIKIIDYKPIKLPVKENKKVKRKVNK